MCKASSKENGTGQYPVGVTQKPWKGDFREHAPGVQDPTETGAFGARLGNRSIFNLDPRLHMLGQHHSALTKNS